MVRKHYVFADEEAAMLWEPILGNFAGPASWHGSDSLRSYIRSSVKLPEGHQGASSRADEIRIFLKELRYAFENGIAFLDKRDYAEVIRLWSPVADSELFDLDSPLFVDKPYYLCQVAAGICQLFVANANSYQKGDLSGWMKMQINYLTDISKIRPLDPSLPGYFNGRDDEASAQNYNLANVLRAASGWIDQWGGPELVAGTAGIPAQQIKDLNALIQQRARETSIYLDD
jgi:hypothetical protein